jgi:hypothetical protein
MNLFLSIGIAVAGIVLGFLVGQQFTRREFKKLTEYMLDAGIILLKVNPTGTPDEEGVWDGERSDLVALLNNFENEKNKKKEKKANGTS